jgi:hypothetical protein
LFLEAEKLRLWQAIWASLKSTFLFHFQFPILHHSTTPLFMPPD